MISTSSRDARPLPGPGPRPLPQPERTKDCSQHLLSNPVPTPCRAGPPPLGNAFGEPGGGIGAPGSACAKGRGAGWGGGAGPGAPGPPRAAPYLGAPQAGEAARSRRGPRSGPLAAGRSWAGAAAAAAGSPGLWAEAAADAATAPQAPLRSGTRRPQARPLRGPGPGSAPDQHLEPDRNCPTCSCSPTGATTAAAAPNRTRGRRHGPPCHRRASLRPHGGGPAGPARSSALRAPTDAPQPSARLPGSFGWAGGRSRLSPRFPRPPARPPATQWGRGGSQRPPAARRPPARLPSRRLATAARVRRWREGRDGGRPRLHPGRLDEPGLRASRRRLRGRPRSASGLSGSG